MKDKYTYSEVLFGGITKKFDLFQSNFYKKNVD